ncbi:MAG: carboxylating nicotinate-nucleotide diphosphorylase [Gallionella sp.]|nr:carboxylating nicotinate-nucleotide diphosphorylase [Gallionella sp.]
MLEPELAPHIRLNVSNSLNEDVFTGDLTAQLLPPDLISSAQVITRQHGVLCGTQWFDKSFYMLDPDCKINWLAKDGDSIAPGQLLCEICGKAQAMLTAERSALNLLQTLSGTATRTRRHVDAVAGINVKIMDTRKTLPGLRHAQKYAVRMGGGHNQRTGLFDGILIKENHIAAAGGIRPVLEQAFRLVKPGISVQIEVENLAQLDEALSAGAKLILLDNFDLAELRAAVQRTAKRAELEASGGITLDTLREVALTGVDRISIGALTKDVEALDLSMRFTG